MYEDTMGAQAATSGWYPDPQVAGTLRYWDGTAWSEHTATGYDTGPAAPQVLAPYQHTVTSRPQRGFVDLNRQSLVALAFVAGYVVLALVAGIVLLGILPIMAAFRAVQAKEPMAPLAMVLAVGSAVSGFLLVAG